MNSTNPIPSNTLTPHLSSGYPELRHERGHLQAALILLSGLMLSFILLLANPVHAKPNTADSATIEYLIGYVSQSDMVFVRNFGQHTSHKAAKHIRTKYEHFYDDIDSPENFIELCATKSLVTGKNYIVIDPQGNKVKTSEWLLSALKTYRQQGSE